MFTLSAIGQPRDLRLDYTDSRNRWHLPRSAQIDADGRGHILWQTAGLEQRSSFNCSTSPLEPGDKWDFPNAYGGNPQRWPCEIIPLSERAIRIRLNARPQKVHDIDPGIFIDEAGGPSAGWAFEQNEQRSLWCSPHGSFEIQHERFALTLRDADNRIVWQSFQFEDAKADSLYNVHTTPIAAIRREQDYRWQHCFAWSLQPDEVLVGGGEHFGPGNKRGQTMHWCTTDPHGTQSPFMYKPVPFLMSNQGYGLLFHTTARITADLGQRYHSAASAYVDDDHIDVVLILGDPQEILSDYTALSGRSPVPPLWSFGLWMSRITYSSEDQVREVASKLRAYEIPCDVIHVDTGWFAKDWCCDYEFSTERFDDPAVMIEDLAVEGFKISLWQLPYFTPENPLHQDISDNFAINDGDGELPTGDAIVDFSDQQGISWYQDKLGKLLKIGVAAIKVDFGEAAPVDGHYASGQSGRYEHNRYPMRYQQAAFEVTETIHHEGIVWAAPGGLVANVFPFTGAAMPKVPIKVLPQVCVEAFRWACAVLAFGVTMPVVLRSDLMQTSICVG